MYLKIKRNVHDKNKENYLIYLSSRLNNNELADFINKNFGEIFKEILLSLKMFFIINLIYIF